MGSSESRRLGAWGGYFTFERRLGAIVMRLKWQIELESGRVAPVGAVFKGCESLDRRLNAGCNGFRVNDDGDGAGDAF